MTRKSNAAYLHWACVAPHNNRYEFGSVFDAELFWIANPYVNAPSCHVNLLELSRYAKRWEKKLVELTQDEVERFSI